MSSSLIEIEADPIDIIAVEDALGVLSDKTPRVLQGALSDTIKQTRTLVKKRVREIVPFKAKFVTQSIVTRLPSFKRLEGSLHFSSLRVPISDLKFSPKSNRRRKRGKKTKRGKPGKLGKKVAPVRYRIETAGAEKVLPAGFVARWPNNKLRVFQRSEPSGNFPIRQPRGPSIAPVIEKHNLDDEAQVFANNKLPERIEDRVDLLLERTFGA